MKKSDKQPAQVLSPVSGKDFSSRVKSTGQPANDSEAVISSIPSAPAEAVTTADTLVTVPVEVSRESDSTALNAESLSRNIYQTQAAPAEHVAGVPLKTGIPAENGIPGESVKTNGAEPATSIDEVLKTLTGAESCKEAGMKLLNQGNNTGAETVFLKGLEFDNNNPDILNCLGLACYAQAKIKQAKIFFKTAIAVDKYHAEAYYNIGDVLFDEGNLNAAMRQYKIAIDLNPALSRKKRPFYVGDTVDEIRSYR